MAGTPTTNYQFPTYATTDVPDLTGAYNQAVNAIDAKIKEVADTIPSGADVPDANSTTKGIAKLYDSTTVDAGNQDDGGITPNAVSTKVTAALASYAPKFTAAAPITYSDNQIGIRYSNPAADGAQNGYGAVQVTGKQSDVASADSLTTATVPNVKAVKDYVDAKVPTEQQAYTGTAPIVVDAESRAIGINEATYIHADNVDDFLTDMQGNPTAYKHYEGAAFPIVDAPAYASIVENHDENHNWPASRSLPNIATLRAAISAIPSATTSVNGLVMLTDSLQTGTPKAVTSTAVNSALGSITQTWPALQSQATTPLTTEMLANLYVTPSGLVVYKAPTE